MQRALFITTEFAKVVFFVEKRILFVVSDSMQLYFKLKNMNDLKTLWIEYF